MGAVGGVIDSIFDLLLLPFRGLPPVWGLLFVSLLTGVWMIAVFGAVSDQARIRRIRRRMGGQVAGILLHVSRPTVVLRLAGGLIASNFVYLWLLLVPLLVIALPFALTWGQLEARYGGAGPEPGRALTLTLAWEEGLPEREMVVPAGEDFEYVPPVVMVDTLMEASFRLSPNAGSPAPVRVTVEGTTFTVGASGEGSGRLVYDGFDLTPGPEAPMEPGTGGAERIGVGPVEGRWSLSGVDYDMLVGRWSWAAVFLVMASLSALVGARVLRVRI